MATLSDLKPFVSKDLQTEISAVEKLYALFPGVGLAQIVKKFEKYQKEHRTSADGLAQRIGFFRSNRWPDSESPETAQAILADYAKLSAAKAKELGKLLGINIVNPKDSAETAAFSAWLNGGSAPPTEAEKITGAIDVFATDILQAMDDRRLGRLSIDDCVKKCKSVVAEVQKKYKAPGLLILTEAIHLTANPKDTAPKMAKSLNMFFDDRAQKWKRDQDIDPR